MNVVINTAYLALLYNIENYYHFIIWKLKDFTDYAVIMRHSLCSVSNVCEPVRLFFVCIHQPIVYNIANFIFALFLSWEFFLNYTLYTACFVSISYILSSQTTAVLCQLVVKFSTFWTNLM